MAPLLLSDDATFYTWAAVTCAIAADVAAAIARGWARGRRLRLRFEDVIALLQQVGLRLLAVRVIIPEARRRRGGEDAVGPRAAVERFRSDEAYVWPVGCFLFGVFVLDILVAVARRRRRRRRLAPPQRAAAAGQGNGGGRVPWDEFLLFPVLLRACVYRSPVWVRGYMAATANGRDAAAP